MAFFWTDRTQVRVLDRDKEKETESVRGGMYTWAEREQQRKAELLLQRERERERELERNFRRQAAELEREYWERKAPELELLEQDRDREIYEHPIEQEEQLPMQPSTPILQKEEIKMATKEVQPPTTLAEPKLYEAVTKGDINYLKSVPKENIEAGLLISPQGNTVLHVAASFGHHEMVQIICKRFPSILRKTNSIGDTALHNAARDGYLMVVNVLIDFAKRGRDLETGFSEEVLLRMTNADGNTALLEATRKGHQMVAKRLIEVDKESRNIVNHLGESSLYLAAEGGLDEVVTLLLTLPMHHDPHEYTQHKTPLHAAVIQDHTRIIKILMEKRPDFLELRDNDGRSSLHYAAFLGRVEAVRCLLNIADADRYYHHDDHRDNKGIFPIHMAAMNGHIKVIQELLVRFPDSRELRDFQGRNFLHVAVTNNKENVVKFILRTPELGKLINERNENGNTPLHLASMYGHASVANVLTRDKRVDIGIVNEKGHTPYEAGKTGESSFQKVLAGRALVTTNALRCKRRVDIKDDTEQEEKVSTDHFKDRINTLLLVATLIITITFSAGLTMPGDSGGNHNSNNNNNNNNSSSSSIHLSSSSSNNNNDDDDKGMENMLTEVLKCIYVISNTIAMYSSIVSAIVLLWAYLGDSNILDFALRWSMVLLAIALSMVAITFTAGVNLVVSKLSWLAIVVMAMSFIFGLCILALFIPLQVPMFPKNRWTRLISNLSFRLLLFATRHEFGKLLNE